MRRNAAYLPSTTSGTPFIRNSRVSPSFAAGQVLLRDHVAVARDRLDHLVEVAHLARLDHEHVRAARALQRLEHRAAALLLDELADVLGRARDQRARPHLLGEVLEVHLVDRVGEAARDR